MGNIGERIKRVREQSGLNQTDFALKLGLGGPTAVSKYEKEQREPDIQTLTKIANLGNVSLDWLLTGEGEKESGSYKIEEKSVPYGEADFISIPMVSGKISAGGGLVPDTNIELKLSFKKDWIQRHGDPKNMSLIRVSGDSMEPTLYSGDIVLVDHSRNYIDPQGGIYAVAFDDVIMIKRVQVIYPSNKVRILSDNAKYEPLEASSEWVAINGKVIWFGREI